MGWATFHIEKLKRGETVQFRPRGNSMKGKIESGELCTVSPVKTEELKVGDIVLCKVGGAQYLHLIKAQQGGRFQIGNNRGRINGWIGANGIFGRCIRVEVGARWHRNGWGVFGQPNKRIYCDRARRAASQRYLR